MNKINKEIKNICFLCNCENNNLTSIIDNYIKIEGVFIPLIQIVFNTLGIEVNNLKSH